MSVTAGALSKVLIASSTAQLASAVATAGTGPYTYQWYRSLTTGFSPGAGSLIPGATSLSLSDSGLVPGTQYYYLVQATDTGASNVTSNSAQLSVLTEPSLVQNQFAQSNVIGFVDMQVGPTNIISVQVDASASAPIQAGQYVKVVSNTVGGVPRVVACSANSDAQIGQVIFNIKDVNYPIGSYLEVALWGSVVWSFATGAVSQFARVCLDVTYVGGVQATGNSSTIVGWAFDGAAAAGPIRVMLMPNAAYTTA